MKKLIYLVVVAFIFGIVPYASAESYMVTCKVTAGTDNACTIVADLAAADKLKADMSAKTIDCTVAASTAACPVVKPSAPAEVKDPGVVKLDNPLALSTDIKVIIGTLIKGVLGVMGGLVLLMVVWGGITWITAAGSPEKVKSGSQTILWALLGAVITTASYIILNGIMDAFFSGAD